MRHDPRCTRRNDGSVRSPSRQITAQVVTGIADSGWGSTAQRTHGPSARPTGPRQDLPMSDLPRREPTPEGLRIAEFAFEIAGAILPGAVDQLGPDLPNMDAAFEGHFAAISKSLRSPEDEHARWRLADQLITACIDALWPEWRGTQRREPSVCDNCGVQKWPQWKFCPSCGTSTAATS